MKRLVKFSFVLFIITGFTTLASAQSANATAEVAASINVTKDSDIDFGTLNPGATSSVTKTSGASYTVSGNGGTVNLSFSFSTDGSGNPALQHTDGDYLSMIFSSTDAGYGESSSNIEKEFDPTSGTSTNNALSSYTNGDIKVFIGGTVDATANQKAGTYSGTITLTATYQ